MMGRAGMANANWPYPRLPGNNNEGAGAWAVAKGWTVSMGEQVGGTA